MDSILHRFPIDLRPGAGTNVRQDGGAYRVDLDLGFLPEAPISPSASYVVGVDPATGSVFRLSLTGLTPVRTVVNDQPYLITPTDQYVAMVALTAARTLTLPSASTFLPGQALFIADESGNCSADAGMPITVATIGSDRIGAQSGLVASVTLGSPFQKLTFHSNGSNLWTFA